MSAMPATASDRFTAKFSGVTTLSLTVSSLGGPCSLAATMKQGTAQGQLATALDNILYAKPPELFAQNYVLVNERVTGGQAVVQVRLGHHCLRMPGVAAAGIPHARMRSFGRLEAASASVCAWRLDSSALHPRQGGKGYF